MPAAPPPPARPPARAMIAALQMYDWPEMRAEVDAWWARIAAALAARGVAAPAHLARPDDVHAPWRDPDLLLGQTCGMPLVLGACAAAVPIARGDYALPGASGGDYASALVVARDDPRDLPQLRGAVVAINSWDSQSGRTALAEAAALAGLAAAPGPVFRRAVLTGSHRASARAVATGRADLAALDAVAWALVARHEPGTAAALRLVGWTPPTPGLPFITAHAALAPALVAALTAASAPGVVGLPARIVPATRADYAPLAAMVARALALPLAPDQPPVAGTPS